MNLIAKTEGILLDPVYPFNPAEKTLDLVPSLVKLCIIPPGFLRVALGRNDRLQPAFFRKTTCCRPTIGFIHQQFASGDIKYYNFWKEEKPEEIWFSRFINSRNLAQKKKICFFSVLGKKNNIRLKNNRINIFFSGENIYSDRFISYRSFCEKQHFDLYIDFNTYANKNSIRFPLWLMFMFEPEATYNDIKARVGQLRYPTFENKQRFCSLVTSHDFNGIRGKMFKALS